MLLRMFSLVEIWRRQILLFIIIITIVYFLTYRRLLIPLTITFSYSNMYNSHTEQLYKTLQILNTADQLKLQELVNIGMVICQFP